MQNKLAPALDVTEWLNGPPQDLASLRGRVVLLEAFQMLCPGCVSHGLPQAQRVHHAFEREDLAVLGLHTVFEHHEVMTREALSVFIDEYRLAFPIGIDRHEGANPLPATMQRYGLRGTPSTILIDRDGVIRFTAFGAVDDLVLGTQIGRLLAEQPAGLDAPGAGGCSPGNACS